jgi:hypothetical protein
VAQGDQVLMISSARGENIDTQAVARASEMDESPRHSPIDTEIAQNALQGLRIR